ncbi:YraN family protein [Hydrogenothermus marinus]|uniref:UPF0102 protein CLV39_0267 n=1 Tax=Hydrogenothermus marinus TaxID=133270 RepID=A0A3M0BKJ5_9AQUI|nr:YraN family protein [Hydrogenothermus marinus]RMA97647.1 putative endonuclease [Hydrogenothermus marinus]
MNKRHIGKEKENIAKEYLKNKGYQILATNFYSKFGEIDIIAKDKNTLVFIEVRSKSYEAFGLPEETIDKPKIQKIIKTAQLFIEKENIDYDEIRFDVISILNDKINHIESAFEV